ncbi:hypothetical protein [Saccharothrix obliqua]|uniref:hypothetical protein n=1 Tax=Saccharothrix obliqua TaxID=2861747 RepID=UPI001C5EDAF5|nr:hypothetical protein [Saccharothrix obliqua]MBW4717188.1 hypothetical protein [Saccharothrix obliqua]
MVDRAHEEVLEHCEREGIAFLPWFPPDTGNLAAAERPRNGCRRGCCTARP